jgi:gamma-glutamyltranspeptidase/glutathione hydrolase
MYLPDDKPKHSDTVVATDKDGNMTAITHSINAVVWGKTAIIVDGISIGDAAVHQKQFIAAITPGERLPDPIEIGILTKDGVPQLAFASMATGLHVETLQSLVNFMDFGMSPKAALDAPSILYPRPAAMLCQDNSESCPDEEKTPKFVVRVMEGAFDRELLEATGLPVEFVKAEQRRYAQGLWVGIMKDPVTGDWVAGSHFHTNGQALGY